MNLELRFFEIYRNPEYLVLLTKGALLSASLTVLAALFGLVLAFVLAAALKTIGGIGAVTCGAAKL